MCYHSLHVFCLIDACICSSLYSVFFTFGVVMVVVIPKKCYSHSCTSRSTSYGPGMTFHSYILLYSCSFSLCRWFCHFDDDSYVNIPVLVKTLQQYNPESERLYLGHMPSIFAGMPERWKQLTIVRYHP